MMNGYDYTASQPLFPEMMERINEEDQQEDRQWIHTTMPKFIEIIKGKIDRSKLVVD